MQWSRDDLMKRIIISAMMPFDDLNSVRALYQDCTKYAGVAALPSFVRQIREDLPKADGCKLIGLAGYPTGGVTSKTKATEIRELYYFGADAFDVVINTAFILSDRWEDAECDLLSALDAAGGRPVIVTLESAYLNEDQIKRIVQVCLDNQVFAIGTATGWLPKLPAGEQIELIKSLVGDQVHIQAAGLMNFDQLKIALDAGADRFMVRRQHAEAILAQV